MATRKRALLEPTDDWQQRQFQLDWMEQTRYELIRPVVVFGHSPVERSQQTGLTTLTRHGAPGTIVSDGGSVFKATHAKAIYAALGITHQRIDPGQPWQSYIETNFNVQRRMADYRFGQAESWAELEITHALWLHDYNAQEHVAHQKRQDGRRSPEAVLGWVLGRPVPEEELGRLFSMRVGRKVDQQGYVRFRNWRIYGERGVAGRRVKVWLSDEYLTIELQKAALAQYTVKYRQDHHRSRAVIPTRLLETDHRSPQLPLLDEGAGDWRLAIEMPVLPRHRRTRGALIQMPLFALQEATTIGER